MIKIQTPKMVAVRTGPLVFSIEIEVDCYKHRAIQNTSMKSEQDLSWIKRQRSSVVLFVTKKILDQPFDVVVT